MHKILLIGQPIINNRLGEVGSGGGYVRNMRVYLKYFQSENFKLVPCFHTSRKEYGISTLSKVIRFFIDLKRIVSALLRERPSAIHIMAQYRKAIAREAMYIFFAKVLNKPVLYEIKAGAFIDAYDTGSNLYRRLVKYAVKNSKIILVEGEKYIDFLIEKYNSISFYFPNVVPDQEIPEIKKDILSNRITRILYVGHCNYEKGIFHLADAFTTLFKEDQNLELNLIGDEHEDLTEYLDQITKENKLIINRFGGRDHAFILSKMQECDIFCFPTFHSGEGHSNSINEAMMNSMVIVTTKNGFLADILRENTAYFIEERNSEDIKDKISDIIVNKENAIAKAQKGYNLLTKNYTVSKVKTIIERHYYSLVADAE